MGGQLAGERLTGGQLAGGPLAGGQLAGGLLTGGQLAGGPLTGGQLAGGPLTRGQLAQGRLTGGQPGGGRLTAGMLQLCPVDTGLSPESLGGVAPHGVLLLCPLLLQQLGEEEDGGHLVGRVRGGPSLLQDVYHLPHLLHNCLFALDPWVVEHWRGDSHRLRTSEAAPPIHSFISMPQIDLYFWRSLFNSFFFVPRVPWPQTLAVVL